MYLHAYGKSGLKIATNTVAFGTEFLPFVIKIYGGVANMRPTFGKINKAIKIILFLVMNFVSIWRSWSEIVICLECDPFSWSLTIFSGFLTRVAGSYFLYDYKWYNVICYVICWSVNVSHPIGSIVGTKLVSRLIGEKMRGNC